MEKSSNFFDLFFFKDFYFFSFLIYHLLRRLQRNSSIDALNFIDKECKVLYIYTR